jgi:hypothetical protein
MILFFLNQSFSLLGTPPYNPYQVRALQVIRILEVSRIMFKKLVKLVDKSCFFLYFNSSADRSLFSPFFRLFQFEEEARNKLWTLTTLQFVKSVFK